MLRRQLTAVSGEVLVQVDRQTDGGGNLDFPEFLKGMRRAHISRADISDVAFAWLFAQIDCNGGGDIDAIEFVNFVTGERPERLEPLLVA